MFNFSKLTLSKNYSSDSYTPFVGIRRNSNGNYEFKLPVGFSDFPDNNFEYTKKLFFSMYKTFRKFEQEHQGQFQDTSPKSKDTIQVPNGAYRFKDKNDDDVLLYSKIKVIDGILSTYDNLMINTVIRTEGKTDIIDFSKIDRHLDKAIYIDDVIYIDDFFSTRSTLDYTVHSIIELYSFILCELKNEMNDDVGVDVKIYHSNFKEKYLGYNDSLFNEETFEHTISILKDLLDKIDQITAYKDDDYWQLYSSIEIFLYGELDINHASDDGIFWGVNNFYQIWEDMCNTYAFNNLKSIIYADTTIKLNGASVANKKIGGKSVFCIDDFEPPYYFSMKDKTRFGRPDLIHKKTDGIKFYIDNNAKHNFLPVVDVTIKCTDPREKHTYDHIIKYMKHKSKQYSGRFIPPSKFTAFSKKELEDIQKKYMKFLIIDWKYIDVSLLQEEASQKIDIDITKQLFYEHTAEHFFGISKVSSQFVVPYFFEESYTNIGKLVDMENLGNRLQESGIRVFMANFKKIQEAYLNYD